MAVIFTGAHRTDAISNNNVAYSAYPQFPTLTAKNTHTGGTFVNKGGLVLAGTPGDYVVPAAADPAKGLAQLQRWVKQHRLQTFVTLTLEDRTLGLVLDDAAQQDSALLDGCYVLKPMSPAPSWTRQPSMPAIATCSRSSGTSVA